MLTHRNFLSNLRAIVKVLPPMQSDHCLNLLPLHHAFAFTGELLVAMWAGATITYPENLRSRIQTLPDLLAHAAARFPQKVALQRKGHGTRGKGQEWVRYTYGELHRLAQSNAKRLAAMGIGRGDRVILCGDNCPEWVIAYFSASCAGATVVPLDRQWRPEDIAHIAQFVDAKAALVGDSLADALREALQAIGLSIPILTFHELTYPS
jgi:acyl-CoA synthetase (AMP-forming)/AMP-acid ligase II